MHQVLIAFEATEVSHCLGNVYRTWDYSGLQHRYLINCVTKRIISLYISPCYVLVFRSFEVVLYMNDICFGNAVVLMNSKHLSVYQYCNSRWGVCCCFVASL